jgi:hypothetical protein
MMKHKTILILFYVIAMTSNAIAQYNLDWQQNANNDSKTSVMSVVDSQDNIIVTGYLQSFQIFTRKYDLSGTLLWEAADSSGINSIYEKSNWVSCDSNNNIYVVGNQYSISSSYDYPNAIVALKYNSTGTLIWKTVIPISILINSTTSFDCRSVVDASGNLYIGTAITNGATLFKLDTLGNLIFTSTSSVNAPKNFNGMRIRNNKIAIATSSGSSNVSPVFVWDTSGTLLWSANAVGLLAADVEIDENENIYVLGSIYNQINATTWDYDAKLTKFSPTGNLLWSQSYDFGGYNFTTRMTYLNNRISAIGYGNSSGINWVTFQTDTSGILLWSSPYTVISNPTYTDEYPHYVTATPNGEVLVTGVGGPTPIPGSGSYNQMPIVQYSNTGIQNWISTPNMYAGTGLAVMFASDGSLYAIGSRNLYVFHYNAMSTSTNENSKSTDKVKIFPNPFSASATLSINTDKTYSALIIVYDILGNVVKSLDANNLHNGENNISLDLNDLEGGIYFCSVNYNSEIENIKLIKN